MGFLRKLARCFKRMDAKAGPDDDQRLIDALIDLQAELDSLHSLFNMTDDEDMIDYFAHEYKALDARHSYLIKQARARGLTYHPRPKETVTR